MTTNEELARESGLSDSQLKERRAGRTEMTVEELRRFFLAAYRRGPGSALFLLDWVASGRVTFAANLEKQSKNNLQTEALKLGKLLGKYFGALAEALADMEIDHLEKAELRSALAKIRSAALESEIKIEANGTNGETALNYKGSS